MKNINPKFKGARLIYSTPATCLQDSAYLLLCASDRVDPCFECNADRTICHGRSYDSPDANGVYYRFDINGQWKPYLPIKLNKIPPNEIHKDMLYIPSLTARIYESAERESRDFENQIAMIANDYRAALEDTIRQHEKDVDYFARQLGVRDD